MSTEELNQLPDLASEYTLSPSQIENYQKDGHMYLKEVLSSAELEVFRPSIRETVEKHKEETRPLSERDTYGKAFLQIMNLWKQNERVRRFVLAKRFAKIAADLMGVDGVRLYHDQALFKEPGGGHTPWHQDQLYWPLDTSNTITMWMPLVDVSAEMGSMNFVSGSQEKEYVTKHAISDESDQYFKDYIQENGYSLHNYGAMQAGDATFHAGWTLHNAPGNPSDRMREVITIIYFADGTRVLEPDSGPREVDREHWLPGLKGGDLAASPLNPLLYTRN